MACQTGPDSAQLARDGEMLAQLTCAARAIRTERFALADSVRALEDSMTLFPHREMYFTQQREAWMARAEGVTARTRQMADSINRTLRRLHGERYKTPDQRKELDEALEAALQRICR